MKKRRTYYDGQKILKKLKSFLSFILINMFFFLLNHYVFGQLTKEQIDTFRSVKTVKIIINQTYKEAEHTALPFREVTQKLLGYAGLEAVSPSAKNYDLIMKIEAEGQATGDTYEKIGYRYTGASISGWISLEMQGAPVYRKSFNGVQETAKMLIQGKSSVLTIPEYKTPSSAPFRSAFEKPDSFVSKMLEVIAEIYGTNPIIAALRDQDYIIRDKALWLLIDLHDPGAVQPLIAMLEDQNWNIRKNAVSALSRIGGSKAEEFLIVKLNDEYSEVREEAARALGDIKDERAVEPLINALKDKIIEVRKEAIVSLRILKDKRAVEPLIASLNDIDSSVRMEAVKALGEIKDRRAVEPLIATLKDKNWEVRSETVEALAEINDSRALEPLINAQKDENSFVRSSIARALGKLGWTPKDDRQRAIYLIDKGFWDDCIKIGEPAVEPLIAALKDKSDYIRENAANALGKIKDNRAVEPLIAVLNDRKGIETVQFEVVKALGAIGDSRAVKPLIAALRDPSYNLPLYAAEALGEIKDIRAVEPLIVALKHERDMVRSYAAEALGKIKDIRAIEPLIALLEDKFDMVQSYTARALRNITGEGFGISRSEWKEWWKENKHKFIK